MAADPATREGVLEAALLSWLSDYDGWNREQLDLRADPATIERIRRSDAALAQPSPQPAASVVTAVPADPHFIRRHGAFFRANASGYTDHIPAAGIYSGDKAREWLALEMEGLTIHPVSDYLPSIAVVLDGADRLRAALAASPQGAVERAIRQAAYLAKNACLVPPDGGDPTEAEAAVCDEAERRILAMLPVALAASPQPQGADAVEAMREAAAKLCEAAYDRDGFAEPAL